jgi:hypothetical protein
VIWSKRGISVSIDVLREIRALLPDVEPVESDVPADESHVGAYGDAPCLVAAECVEDATLSAHSVVGAPEVRFAAFLDGIQRARVTQHCHGIPIVEGTIGAVIRVRPERRAVTWSGKAPILRHRFYMPLSLLGLAPLGALGGRDVIDTSYDGRGRLVSRHPAAVRAVAFERVSRDRDDAEREMAEAWCASSDEPLYVDGGISGSETTATSNCVVGVIKSHQKLYADDSALDVVMSLERGERTSVFTVPSSTRHTVMSWYLRLRDPHRRDAMFGLVRIEVAPGGDCSARANEISRWVLAEMMPNAMPDHRWDRMAYGIQDCERYLRAIA